MKIKNLLVADIKNLEQPLIVKRPNLFKRIIASCIGAEITTFKEVFSNTKIKIHPYDLTPLCKHIDTRYYDKDISINRLRKIKIKDDKQINKRKIGF